jgi:hypothetical protein
MSWTVEYAPERELVVVTASGEIRDEDARAQTVEALYLFEQNRAAGILADYSDAISEVTLAELYWLPDYAAVIGTPWNIPVAVVLPRKPYRLESFQFFELVCSNAGWNVKLFESKAMAEDWLAQAAPVHRHAEPPVPA